MDRATIIYGLVDPQTTQLRYVGKTSTTPPRRLDAHIGNARRGVRQPCASWIGSLLRSGYRPEMFIIEVCKPGSDWEEAEQFWIAYFRSKGCRLLNLSVGGRSGALGWRATDQTKERMKAKLRGRPVSADTRRKIGAANKGRPQTVRQRALNGDARRGEKSYTAKLTERDIPVIRALRAAGHSGSQVASMYGITKQNCDDIHKRVTWSHVIESEVDISGIDVPPIRRLRGVELGSAKLSEDAVRDIRRRLAGKRGTRETGKALAREYGVTTSTISDIRNRKIWRHVA